MVIKKLTFYKLFTIEIIPMEFPFHFSIGKKKIFLAVKKPIVYKLFTIENIPVELPFHFSVVTKKIFLGVKNPIVYKLFTIESDSTTILSISLLVRKK